jgi:hypothetical protein
MVISQSPSLTIHYEVRTWLGWQHHITCGCWHIISWFALSRGLKKGAPALTFWQALWLLVSVLPLKQLTP